MDNKDMDELREKFKISLETPPMDKAAFEASQFVLVRHALSEFNMAQLLTVEKYGAKSPELETFDNDIKGFDPELHPIGIQQAQNHQSVVNEINWKIVFTSPM